MKSLAIALALAATLAIAPLPARAADPHQHGPDAASASLKLDNGKTGWQFTGRGWGHGVGMCQLGAVGMARRGHGYRSILDHYYRGTTIRKFPVATGH